MFLQNELSHAFRMKEEAGAAENAFGNRAVVLCVRTSPLARKDPPFSLRILFSALHARACSCLSCVPLPLLWESVVPRDEQTADFPLPQSVSAPTRRKSQLLINFHYWKEIPDSS